MKPGSLVTNRRMMRTCSAPIAPRRWAAAVWASTGSNGWPVIAARGPSSAASLTRRLASLVEIRNNVDNAAATERSPNSSTATSANPFTSRCRIAGS